MPSKLEESFSYKKQEKKSMIEQQGYRTCRSCDPEDDIDIYHNIQLPTLDGEENALHIFVKTLRMNTNIHIVHN